METWNKLPLNLMDELAEYESYNRYHYRPVYSLHKWWARRPGSTFRSLGLAALSDETVTKEDILHEVPQTGTHEGLYLNPKSDSLDSEATVLDPFAGGGTTLVELNRLKANVVGYELNPVAWWTEKKMLDGVDIGAFEREFENLLEETRDELENLYTTREPGTGKECEALYYFQTQILPCLTCGEEVQLLPQYQLAKGKKTRPGILYCPNQDCDERIIEITRDVKDTEQCPHCDHEFDPSDGTYGYGKYTCSNGHKHDVKETLQRRDEKPRFERFAIQYIDSDGNKSYKVPEEEDRRKVDEAKKRLEELREELPIPDQQIPVGDETDRIVNNYNYEHFNELFTDRHLLTFGLLFEKAWSVRKKEFEDADAQNIAEFLLTAISSSLEYHGKLVKWNPRYSIRGHVFERHALIPRVTPVESNPLNHQTTSNSLEKFFKKACKAKRYCEEPYEKIKNTRKGEVEQFFINGEDVSEERVASLNCKTSENLSEPDESVDYVITDPPYYDNVQYSELSDYFYVWLRECLQEEYSEFGPEVVPKAREIVANKNAGKGEEFFIESLSNVFSECHRVLKPDGEIVFTYHHNENEAWSVILDALIESGFTVTGAYPVQSEMPNNPHISDLDNAEYDILIFANKDSIEEETTLDKLRQDLFFELQDMISEERKRHHNLSTADLGVILRGKCMYYYSRHYPNVYAEGEPVSVSQALNTVDEVIEQVLESSVDLPPNIDSISQAYAAFIQRGAEKFDDLNKHLLAKNLNVSDLEDEKLVKGKQKQKEPATAEERVRFIEQKINGKDPANADGLLDIDKVQYLHHLYVTDQNTVEYLKEWKTNELVELAEFMADVTDDDRYERVMDMSLSQF